MYYLNILDGFLLILDEMDVYVFHYQNLVADSLTKFLMLNVYLSGYYWCIFTTWCLFVLFTQLH